VMTRNADSERLDDKERKSEMWPCESAGLKEPNPYMVVKNMKTAHTTVTIDHIAYLK
jgi:hypothetical protein